MDFFHRVQISSRLRIGLFVLTISSGIQSALLGNIKEPVEPAVSPGLADTPLPQRTVKIPPSPSYSSDDDLPDSAFFTPCSSFRIPTNDGSDFELYERYRHLDNELADHREAIGPEVERSSRLWSRIEQSEPDVWYEANEHETHNCENAPSGSLTIPVICTVCHTAISRDAHEVKFNPSILKEHQRTLSPTENEHEDLELFTRLECGHIYHPSCIVAWLKKRSSCPNCRSHPPNLPDREDSTSPDENPEASNLHGLDEPPPKTEIGLKAVIAYLVVLLILVIFEILFVGDVF